MESHFTEFIKIENKPTVVDEFHQQDLMILEKVKSSNKNIAKDIIVRYSLTHSLKPIFDSFENDYENLKKALDNFSKKRKEELLELTKNL